MSRLAWLVVALAMAAAAPAWSQGTGHLLDSDQPIEINADSLEVQQEKQLAIFRGNVDATQGRMKLRADELQVHYRDAEGGSGSGSGDGMSGSITRIDAIGNVFIWSPTETAQGDAGTYDVTDKRITLTGEVVLTRGENVLRGKRLVMNTATGVSKVDGGGGRVKGLFVPPKSSEQKR